MRTTWQLKLRRAHLLTLTKVVSEHIGQLEGKARDVMARFGKEEQEELEILREIYDQLEEKS